MANILIVDDNPDDRFLMRTVLEADGHDIREAEDGVTALEAARMGPLDLVISDILMPNMDGFALCRAWQKDPELRRVPFMHCSANYIQPTDIAFAKEIGSSAFMAKPAGPGEIRDMVSALLEAVPAADATARLRGLDDESFQSRHATMVAAKMMEQVRELERANVSLVEREHAFRQLFELNPLPMWVIDMDGMQILAVNDAMIQKYGWSRQEFTKKKSMELRPAEERGDSRATMDKIREIDRKLGELKSLRATLKTLAEHCHGDDRPDCPIIDEIAGAGRI